jgi:hypothetical protein
MFTVRTSSCPTWALFMFFVVGLATGQDSPAAPPPHAAAQTAPSASASQGIAFDDLVDSVIRQERRLTDLMRGFKPIIETYIQEEGSQPPSLGRSWLLPISISFTSIIGWRATTTADSSPIMTCENEGSAACRRNPLIRTLTKITRHDRSSCSPLCRNSLANFVLREPTPRGSNVVFAEFVPALTPRDGDVRPTTFEHGSKFLNLP